MSPLTLAYIGDSVYDLVIKSIIVGKYKYWMTSYSKITEVLTIDDMTEDKLIDFLIDLKKEYQDTKLLLFGCSEDYVEIIIKN